MVNPIFIGGLMRSGTSLLRKMLGKHRNITSGLETFWFELDWQTKLARKNEPLKDYINKLGKYYELDEEAVSSLFATCRSGEEFLDKFMSLSMSKDNKLRWLDKTPGNILHLHRIYEFWPNAKVIHILRDPRDVFASFKKSNKYGDLSNYGKLWSEYIGAAESFKDNMISGSNQYIEIYYEQLVNDPVANMKKLIANLDEPWDPAVSIYEGDSNDFDLVKKYSNHESSTLMQLKKPLSNERIGVWQNILSVSDVNEARSAIKDIKLMNRFDEIIAGNTLS